MPLILPPSAPVTSAAATAVNNPSIGFATGLGSYAQQSTDLFKIDDPNNVYFSYVNPSTGVISSANTLHLTGFIPVQQGAYYVAPAPVLSNRRAYYDINLNFISGVYDFGTSAFAVPSGTGIAYVRFTVPIANWETCKIFQRSYALLTFDPVSPRLERDDELRWMLRWSHSILAGIAFGGSGQLIINMAGDSYTQGALHYVTPFTNYLVSKFGDAGGGWSSCGFLTGGTPPWTVGNQPTYLNGNARPTTYAVYAYGNISGNYFTENTADLASASFTQSGDAVEFNFPASPTISGIDLHWIGTGAGSIRYGFGTGANPVTPGSWTTLSVSGTSGVTVVTALSLTGMTQAGTLRIEWVSGTAKLSGVNYKSTANGVRINKLAATGSTISPWASISANSNFVTSYSALGGQLFTYMDGPNDQGGLTYAQWGNYLSQIAANIRVASPSSDIFIVVPPENARTTNIYAISGYSVYARNVALALRCAYKNIRFGDAGNTAEYNYNGTIPLLNSDSLHPNTAGGYIIAAELLRSILPWGSP